MGDDDGWSFNLRTAETDSDSDCDDDDSPRALLSNDTESLQQIDLSAREDRAEYKPNPWSIAKVNAASRPKVASTPATLPAKAAPKGAIFDAFRKQAEKPKVKAAQRRAEPTRPVIAPPAVKLIPLPVVNGSRENSCGSKSNSHITFPRVQCVNKGPDSYHDEHSSEHSTSGKDQTHIAGHFRPPPRNVPPADFTSGVSPLMATQPDKAIAGHSSNRNLVHNHPHNKIRPHMATSLGLSPSHAVSSGTCFPSSDRSVDSRVNNSVPAHDTRPVRLSNASQPPSLTLDPRCDLPAFNQNVQLPSFEGNKPGSTARASIDRLFKRARTVQKMPAHPQQSMSSPLGTISRTPPHHNRQSCSSPAASPTKRFSANFRSSTPFGQPSVPLLRQKIPSPIPPVGISSSQAHRVQKRRAQSPLPSPPLAPYLRSPLPSPVRRTPPARPKKLDPYNSLSSPDSEWSTIPQKEKGGANAKNKMRQSGKFRLPSSLLRRAGEDIGTVAGGKARVVTYLPPPKKKEIMAFDDHGGGHDGGRQISGLPSPPPSDDPAALALETPAAVFDTDGVVRRYATVRQNLRMRKKASNQLWDILGLESCGVVYRDPPDGFQPDSPYEIDIVSWSANAAV